MSSANPTTRPAVLTIAASDSAGMAGVQMDVRTQAALGVHALSVVTATTAQNSQRVVSVNPVSVQVMEDQFAALAELDVAAVKIGLLVSAAQLEVVLKHLERVAAPVVLDPVLSASSGRSLGEPGLAEQLLRKLLPRCDLVTPNVAELVRLTGEPIRDFGDVERAARALLGAGARRVLVKGGHLPNSVGDAATVQDYFCSARGGFWLAGQRLAADNARGTGCAFASAAAAALALGYRYRDAVVIAKMAMHQGLRHAYAVGGQAGPVAVQRWPDRQQELPRLSSRADGAAVPTAAFAACTGPALGLYPVVDRAAWLERLLPLGVTTAQLRVKDLDGPALAAEVSRAVAVARRYHCRLFINDHWRLAMAQGAYGVHLGQEDLDSADLAAIRRAGLRLGVSSHCHYEVARAHAVRPSYIACGPIYPTTSKVMPWQPQGIAGLRYWQSLLDYPLVAIGGIDEDRMAAVAGTGVSGIALISAITAASEPEQATRRLLAAIERGRSGPAA